MNSARSVLKISVVCLLTSVICGSVFAQTLYVPGGTTTGIGDNTANGNVGIGTNSPGAKLEVVSGDIHINSTSNVLRFPSNVSTQRIRLYGGGDGVNDYGFGMDGTDLVAFFGAGGGMTFKAADYDGASLMRIQGNGNIGIGTTSPRSRLDIGGHIGANNGARFGDYLEINEREYIDNRSTLGWNAYIAANDGTFSPTHAPGTGMVLAMAGGGDANLDFWGRNWGGNGTPVNLDSFTHVMRLSINGNVGIGTTSPSHKLAVNGTVRAKEVIVDTGWSDYVFADDYRLAPLAEVEAHIREKKHLPGIPAAAEVEQGGVSLGDMQAKLLAKLEEVTLHLIAQEKAIHALQRENSQLRARMKQMEGLQ